jgi:hypothetical protein
MTEEIKRLTDEEWQAMAKAGRGETVLQIEELAMRVLKLEQRVTTLEWDSTILNYIEAHASADGKMINRWTFPAAYASTVREAVLAELERHADDGPNYSRAESEDDEGSGSSPTGTDSQPPL